MHGSSHFVGLDLGQSQDFTALVVLERVEVKGAFDHVVYAHKLKPVLQLRWLERIALGTAYPDVVERVKTVMRSPALCGRGHLVADATGVGRPVVDLIKAAEIGCKLWPVLITGGEVESSGQGFYRVPKRDLIIGLQVLLQKGHLRIAKGLKEAATLLREMREMRVRVTTTGAEQYGVWRQGEHDDLVLAVALACWAARRVYPEDGYDRERYWTV